MNIENNKAVVIDYTNWKGERSNRTIVPVKVYWGSNEWHTTEQWLLEAFDLEKQAIREFAMNCIHSWIDLYRCAICHSALRKVVTSKKNKYYCNDGLNHRYCVRYKLDGTFISTTIAFPKYDFGISYYDNQVNCTINYSNISSNSEDKFKVKDPDKKGPENILNLLKWMHSLTVMK